jgi:hypothetical protein
MDKTQNQHAAANPKREEGEFVKPVHDRNFFPRPSGLNLIAC